MENESENAKPESFDVETNFENIDDAIIAEEPGLQTPLPEDLSDSVIETVIEEEEPTKKLKPSERLLQNRELFTVFLYFMNCFNGVAFGFGICVSAFMYMPLQEYFRDKFPIFYFEGEIYEHFFISALFACTVVGGFIVATFFGSVVDSLGRKVSLMIQIVMSAISVLGIVFSFFYPMILCFLLIFGFYLGMVAYLIPLYVGENSSKEHEKTLGVVFQIGLAFGVLLCNVLNILFAQLPSTFNWRLGISFNFVFTLVYCLLFYIMPESPQWTEARRLKKLLKRDKTVKKKIAFVEGLKKLCSEKRYLKNFFVGLAMVVGYKLTGVDIIGSYTPVLFVQADFDDTSSKFYSLSFALFQFVASFMSLAIINRAGRKILVLFGLVLQICAILAAGLIFQFTREEFKLATAIVGVICFGIFIFGFNVGLGPAYFGLINIMEFPQEIRTTILGFYTFLFYFFQCIVFLVFTPLTELFQSMSYLLYAFSFIGFLSFWVLLFLMKRKYSIEDGEAHLEMIEDPEDIAIEMNEIIENKSSDDDNDE